MRSIVVSMIAASLLAGCVSQAPAPSAPAKAEPAAAAKTAEAPKPPQCYSAESGKFHNVGEKSVIAGLSVTCKASADGKSAAWAGDKH